ncbi:MAG: DUF4199 domain-containing protein [Chitinophagales bacterium]
MNNKIGIEIGKYYGMTIGSLMVIVYLLLYFTDVRLFLNFWIGISFFVVTIAAMVIAAKRTKTELGGYATFQQALQPAFLTIVIVQFIGNFFNYLMYNFVDPSLSESLREVTIEMTYGWLQNMNAPEEVVEQSLSDIEQQDFTVSLSSTLIGFAVTVFVGFGIAAIVALFVRNEPPTGYVENDEVVYEEL